jgi:drug/metabolite transporter (DMT)-like permease
MEPFAVALVAVAAVLHVGWNVLLKTAGDPLWTATVATVTGSLGLVPLVIGVWLLTGMPEIPGEAVVIGLVSGLVETVYFILLSAAYRRGDLSLVYPLARGTAPLVAVAIGVVILGERLPPPATVGVALLIGGLLATQRPWRLLRRAAAADHAAAGFALGAGVAIATYTALDRVGTQLLAPWMYAAILWTSCAIGLVTWQLLVIRPRAIAAGSDAAVPWWAASRPGELARAVVAGVMTLVAYYFVLVALSVAPLSAVAPLRESAIVLAAGIGVAGLGERSSRVDAARRLGAALLILAGALLLALGR